MFTIKIAGLTIRVNNRYEYLVKHCRKYFVEDCEPDFSVGITDEADWQEFLGIEGLRHSEGYAESLYIYRQIAIKVLDYDAFLMHAAIVAVDGEAYAFAAKSGTGKSTHMGLWLKEFGEKAQVVNGDKPILRFFDGKLFACGTPWCGKEKLNENIIRPIKAIAFLERAEENRLGPIDFSEMVPRIFQQLLIPYTEEDFDKFWALLNRMLETVPCYRLCCNMEQEAARVAYNGMKGASINDKG